MEFALAELLPTQNLVVGEVERSSYFPPSCREEEAPMIFRPVEEVEDSSNYPSSRCSRSSVHPRAAALTGSSEAWPRMFDDLSLLGLLLLPSRPSSLRLMELAEPVWLDQN